MPAGATEVRFRMLSPEAPADEIEHEVLRRWAADDLFAQTLQASEGRPEFVFFEGPPTANGKPGIHHVFSRTLKDLFCRYKAMSGFHVTRKAGWDTHGLPVEIEVEKALGISGKQDIERIGVEKFNRLCRESVWRYRSDWEKLSERIAYWLDYSDPYVTYENDYVESVWWALATLHQKGLLYRGYKILPYCPRCGTGLSSHEVAQGYRTVTDPSVYVALPLEATPARRILVWTTTPWTLVSNVALAVHPELDYLELRRRGKENESIIIAAARAHAVLGADYPERWEVVREMLGAELAGLRYTRPLDWVEFREGEGEHEVIVAELFVSAEDGTGVVHMAPAFGADDYAAGQRHGLAFLQPVDARGRFPDDMPLVGGRFVKEADADIIGELKQRDVLWKAGEIEHQYPHCWRCDTPLLYYARGSWFIRTTAFRDEMLARNSRVNWNPREIGEGRFGEWLVNNIDWAISRDRYWGTPLPLWLCDRDDSHVEAVASFKRLAELSGTELGDDFDPHKPYIDSYSWRCTACGGTMRRVPEVIDTWFDSGSMPFAQWHFPFENREQLERHFPADFIAEGVDQTRGWFYSLLAIAAGLGDALPRNTGDSVAAPYRAVVVNDHVLDASGAKMSKRLGNIVDPWAVIPRYGADTVRLFLIASSQVWNRRSFDENTLRDTAGRFLLTLKNVYSGIFALYANFGWEPSHLDARVQERPIADRWILSRLSAVESEADERLGLYDATLAARAVMDFVVDDVSNWYVRLNRHRFYDVDTPDNRAAFATLHEVLVVTSRLLAPFAPFVTDWMHMELTGSSVHLAPYTRAGRPEPDEDLETAMSHVRTLAKLARAAREEAGIRVRQPLSRLVCVVPIRSSGTSTTNSQRREADAMRALAPLLRSELNVKEVTFLSSADDLVSLEARPNFRALGKKFGKATPLAAAAIAELRSEDIRGFERGEPLSITVAEERKELDAEDFTVVRRASGELVVQEDGGYFAAIDPAITDELRNEGLAREVVSRIQRLRKEAGLAVSDRIRLSISGSTLVVSAVQAHVAWVSDEVLAVALSFDDPGAHAHEFEQQLDIDGESVRIAFTRVV